MAEQLALFVARTCLCLRGDQGEPEGHDGECVWVCLACEDTFRCDGCRADLIIGDREPEWNASLGRPVVTVPTLYGLFEGAPGWVAMIRVRRDGRIRVWSAPGARSVETVPLPAEDVT